MGENENAESAIRRFRKAVMSSGHIQEVREIARDDATTMTTTARGSVRIGLSEPSDANGDARARRTR